jgi:ribosome-associated protein
MIKITKQALTKDPSLKIAFTRSPGPGGQNVNKLATAVELHFNITGSTLFTEALRLRLISQLGSRLTQTGELIIKASRYRTQERNKADAFNRLVAIIQNAMVIPKQRKKTRPSLAANERRLASKKRNTRIKSMRNKIPKEI